MLDKEDNTSTSSHRVVGKFFTNSTPPSLEETEQSLRKQWPLSGDMTVQKLDDDSDTFLFEFTQVEDKECVLIVEGTCNVNGVNLVLKDPDSFETIDFTVTSFLVVLQGLPPDFLSEENIPAIQSEVGSHSWYPSERVIYFQVEVDLKKPLRRGHYYLNQSRFVKFKYRNLGDFCYSCGMIGHIRENCNQVKSPKTRAVNATSSKQLYGPWLRLVTSENMFYETVLIKSSKNGSVGECEKTLLYPQFFIELEFNNVFDCNPRIMSETESTHKFRFPCSYLDTETEAYEVMRREIYENTPFSFSEFEDDEPEVISDLVECLKLIQKNEFCSDDKWLTLTLQINKKELLTSDEYETMLLVTHEDECLRLINSKISDLIKRRVEQQENLLCLSTWENQIKQVIPEVGCNHYIHLRDVSGFANIAMEEAVRMELSSSSCPIPAERSTFSTLEHFKVLGPDMDRLDPCMICSVEMFLGEEATVLPCSHVFHSSCIEKWLQVGHKCPLCGFKLPSRKRKRTISPSHS